MHAISSISVCCVPLLKEIVKEFVSEIVRHAIVLKEQEIRLKAKLKVWKYDPEEVKSLFYFHNPFLTVRRARFLRKMSWHV